MVHTITIIYVSLFYSPSGTTERSAFNQYSVVFSIVTPAIYITHHFKHRLANKQFMNGTVLKIMACNVNKGSYD